MRNERKLAMVLIVLMGILSVLCAGTAQAKPDQNREGLSDGKREGMNRPIHGEIISISDSEIVIAPSIPDMILEKMAERGIDPPDDLPDEVVIALTDKTRYFSGGEKADAGGFAAGDMVVIGVRKGKDGPVAIAVADLESARQFLEKRMGGQEGGGHEFGQGGPDGGQGQQGGGPGMHGRGRPMFGEILSIDDDSITIQPEIPDFVVERMGENGVMPKMNLPDELTFSISDETVYIVGGEPQDSNPFKVGDKVGIRMQGTRNDPVAVGIVDYETVKSMAENKDSGERPRQRDPNRKGPRGNRR